MSALEDAAVLSQRVCLPHEGCGMQVRANQHEGHQGEVQPIRASQGSSGSAAQAGTLSRQGAQSRPTPGLLGQMPCMDSFIHACCDPSRRCRSRTPCQHQTG